MSITDRYKPGEVRQEEAPNTSQSKGKGNVAKSLAVDPTLLSDFVVRKNTRCLNHIDEIGMLEISIDECAARCRNRLDCAAFTQYDNGNGLYAGCFLYASDKDCKPGTKWITVVRGL